MSTQEPGTPQVSQQVVQATVQALAQTLATLTKQEISVVLPFAEQWGPQATVWGAKLAAAKQANDQALVDRLTIDLNLLADDAALEAVDYGINSQAAGENTTFALINFAGQFAAHMAVIAIA